MDMRSKFAAAMTYDQFLATHGTREQQERWRAVYERVVLSPAQQQVLTSMTRRVHVLCMAGAWCGDCVEQCPIFARFGETTDALLIRFIDRDVDPELRDAWTLCGAPRVPQIRFYDEDFLPLGWYGDRTLAKYRRLAELQLGASCPTGLLVDEKLLADVTQDWLNEFERIHWIVRLSTRLRNRHRD